MAEGTLFSAFLLINKLESVQRIFTKRLNGLSSLAHNNRLTVLGLERLEMRRLKVVR